MFSGLFDRLPNLTLILGHLGETLPHFAWRIQHCFEYNPFDKKFQQKRLQDYLCENFYITTSGNFNWARVKQAEGTIPADKPDAFKRKLENIAVDEVREALSMTYWP